MAKSIFVGNLPFSVTEDELRTLFETYGAVQSVNLISDRQTGRPRGFGFVEMEADEANAAIEALDGQDFGGRALHINIAKERSEPRPKRRDY